MAAADTGQAIYSYDANDTVMTGEAVELELRPTPFVLAAAGAIIDWLVYFIGGLLLLAFAVITPLAGTAIGQDGAVISAFLSAGLVLVLVIIPIAVELLSKGKSLGRLAVGARIVRDDGAAIGFRHAFIRNIMALVEIYALFGSVAAIAGLTNDRSKRVGDLLAGTYSQYERVPKQGYPLFGVPPELAIWATTADVARIPNRLSLRATKFLRQAASFTPTTREAAAAQLANDLSAWVSPLPAVSPELFVVGVVALRRERETRAHQLEHDRLASVAPVLNALPHGFPKRESSGDR